MRLLRWWRWRPLLTCHHRRFLCKYIPQYGEEVQYGRFIPERGPADEVWMIDLPLRINMLARPHYHGLGRRHVNERRLAGVCVRNP